MVRFRVMYVLMFKRRNFVFFYALVTTENVVTEGGRRLRMNQELRYNLATKVMRNGVEVIVATDKNLRPLEAEYLRHLSSTVTRPITLAPHTLTNLMSMVLPTENSADGQNHLVSILQPSFITRTFYTTYNYPATILTNNTTAMSNLKTVITNVVTQEHSERTVQPTETEAVILNSSPTFLTEIFHTVYTYWNTFNDGEQPIVLSSTQTLSNTLVGSFGNGDLEPSEVFPTTNTYLKTIEFTKTLTDGTDFQVISTKDLVTQVVITDRPIKRATSVPITTDVTKTYFVTYTYFSTYVDGDQTKVKSDVSVSSDVTIEKFYIKPKRTETKFIEQTGEQEASIKFSTFPFNILATRTYLTTFTYFTTLLQGPNTDKAETKVNSRTKIVENTVTQTISLEDFNADYLVRLNSSLNKISGSLVATATLKGGEKVRITAHRNPNLSSSYLKYDIKPTKTVISADTKTETYQLGKKEPEAVKVKSTYSKPNLLLSKTKSSPKSKVKSTKTSIREATAEALVATEEETKFISVTPTVTLTPASASFVKRVSSTEVSAPVTVSYTPTLPSQEKTVTLVEQVVKDQKTQPSDATDPSTPKPVLKQPSAAVNVSNLLNLNSLGINGMNVLGPVFNAMAELIHNNLNKNVDLLTKRNDTIPPSKEGEQVSKKPASNSINPLLSFVNKFTPSTTKVTPEPKTKATTPRTPVYIPVGSFAKDSEFSESQDTAVAVNRPENWHEKWTDAHAKNFEKGRPHDSPITILEGGIPISPGQVITTNSDVIIGRPGESGPRPPTFAVKNNVPVDMKPPPLPQHLLSGGEDEDGFVGQHSTNQGINFNADEAEHGVNHPRPPVLPPKKHSHDPHKNARPHPNDRYKGSHHHKNPHTGKHHHGDYDSGTIDLNPPPVPPAPVRSHDVHRPITINHEQEDESESYKPPNHILPIPIHLGPNQNVENYINPADISPAVLGMQIHQENIHHIFHEPTPSITDVNPNGIVLIPTVAHLPLNLVVTENSNLVDRSTGHQLLVNIQPSQVANIVIPHGSSTALILSDGKQHSLKGEVIDDPSPHPEPETVGFVGAEPVLKIENEDLSASIPNDVIPAEAAAVAQQSSKDNRVLSNRPHLTTELIKIRPKPPFSDANRHSLSSQNSHHLLLGQHQSQGSRPVTPVRQDFSYLENHRQTEHGHKNEDVYSNAGSTGINIGQASEANKIYQNYRKEGATFFNQISKLQNIPPHAVQSQHKHHNYLLTNGGPSADQNKYIQSPNPVRSGNGIYVDISPPGHLPPRPNANLMHQSHSSDKQQSSINEHLLNHQSGLVHDVPLNAQVQLGTGQKKENLLKEILISANKHKQDSIYDQEKKPVEGKVPENLKRPLLELPENLSPPPFNKEGNYRIHRPQFQPPIAPVQRYPPYPHQPVPKPFDFMIPPPQISQLPNQKPHTELTRPHSEHHSRPIIPVGAGAQHNYPNPRPEDIVIVPHKNRPGQVLPNYVNNVNHDIRQHNLGISSDLDVSEPLKTEYGEEIQESISRPLFPGQLPVELQKLNASGYQNHKDVSKTSQNLEINDTAAYVKQENNSHKENSEDLTNVSTQWHSDFKKNPVYDTEDTSSTSSQPSFFSFIKRPSGFVTTSNAGGTTNHKESSTNHKESTSHQEQTLDSTQEKGTGSIGGSKIRIHAVGPSALPSGFVKNEHAFHKRPATVTAVPELIKPPRQPSTNSKIHHQNIHPVKESQGPTRNKKPPSNDVPVFGLKNKVQPAVSHSEQLVDQIHGTAKVPIGSSSTSFFGVNKPTKRPEPHNHSNASREEATVSKQKVSTGQKNKLPAVPEPEGATSKIKFDSNKISTGLISTPGIYNKPHRYPINNLAASQSIKTNKWPSGFTTKKEEKVSESIGVANNNAPSPAEEKNPTPREPVAPLKVPSGFTTKNETDHSYSSAPNHNYGNKTIHFYEPKPSFDLDEEHDVVYNKGEGNVNKWFATNFGDSNSDADSNNKPTNKLSSSSTHRNVSSLPNTGDSDVHIALLTPPKIGDERPKLDEVMGLSPPPLERPRRPPQTGHRPKPPFKFEIPTTPKSTLPPIAIENDFPPVRSPDFNRKPLKPQDIFPPRLPDNFIHHLPEIPVRNNPKPKPVTSMPIDPPSDASTKKNVYSADGEENDGRDTFFAGSEINGHSKPIIEREPILSSMRPPPPPVNRAKPSPQTKPTTTYQQPPKIRTSERVKSETLSTAVAATSTTLSMTRKEISPTPTTTPSVKTTFHTKVSTSVTPTAMQTQKGWQYHDIITGSETIFDPDKFSSYVTPTIHDFTSKKNIVTTLISTGSTTIFGDLYTSGPKKITSNITSIPNTVKSEQTIVTPTKTVVPVHTTTLTVTTTMTTVVHSIGHKPFTKTIVLTKTLISTVVNKITETKTLVKPTTEIVTQTHTIATTKTALVVPTAPYPTQTKYPPGGTLKPEIFVADPHAKDTMTISVSSSMNNKHKQGEDTRKVAGGRPNQEGKEPILVFEDSDVSGESNNLDVISDEENDVNESRVVVGGVFDANNEKEYKERGRDVECSPGCKAKRNELCQRVEGVMKCVCRPGFARMFPDRPCRPTYTYNVQLLLEKFGPEQVTHQKNFAQSVSPNMAKLASATKEGLDRMIMQSDLRDIYHGVMVNGFQGKGKKTTVEFYVQLSENTDEAKLTEILKKTLQASNYSLGGTELFAARESGGLYAEDFNECLSSKFHDCSENARCFNLKGTYTCSCKEGFTDLSENSQFPGRLCSDAIGCEYCGYHGACYSKGEGQMTCECFQWYSGERCHINLKVLLIALVTIGAILLALLSVCAVMTCLNRKSRSSTASRTNGSSAGYLRYRGPSSRSLDRRAMIGDSSSESSVDNLPYICSPTLPSSEMKKKPVLRHVKGPAPRPVPPAGMERDRSVTVMIPRAKYRPMPPLSPHLTMSTFSPDKHLSKTAAQIASEAKLLSYLDGNSREDRTTANTIQNNRQAKEQQKNGEFKSPSPNAVESPKPSEKKKESKVFEYEYKISKMLFTEETNSTDKRSFRSLDDRFRRHSDSTHLNSDISNRNQFRKYSAGALVSAGYEVSAKVGMHHLEEDTTEDERSLIINSHTLKSNRSQFTTLNRTGDHKTMSEARSYDETTVHPPTRSLKTHYSGSSPSSRVNNDEGHTMIERDLGSTFIMPESQLFKPEADRGSDISNFDSL